MHFGLFLGNGAPTKQQSLDLKSYLVSQWPTFMCQCFQNYDRHLQMWQTPFIALARMVQFITIFVKLRTQHLRLNVFWNGRLFQKETPKHSKWTNQPKIILLPVEPLGHRSSLHPMVCEATLDLCHLPVASCNAMQCSTKLLPKKKKRKSCPLRKVCSSCLPAFRRCKVQGANENTVDRSFSRRVCGILDLNFQ